MNPSQYPTTADIESVNTIGKTAAPLLAGFSMSLIGVIVGIDSEKKIMFPNLGLLFLFFATVLFVITVQFTALSSRYCISEDEHTKRTPELIDADRVKAYGQAMSNYRAWVNRSQLSFDFGLGSLFLGITVILLQPNPSLLRIFIVVSSFLVFIFQLTWSLNEYVRCKQFMKSLEDSPEG